MIPLITVCSTCFFPSDFHSQVTQAMKHQQGKSLTSSFNTLILSKFQTFLTLSLQDMASRVQLSGPQEAEKYVLHMVRPLTWLNYPKISVWMGSAHSEQFFFTVEEMLSVCYGV